MSERFRKGGLYKMSQIKSNINSILTLDYLISEPENKYFDCKSAKVRPVDIADLISAPNDFCRPMPQYKEEFLHIINEHGQNDRLLLLHISASVTKLYAQRMILHFCGLVTG